ncbi:hypothetical protein K402DRAFT_381385 [Aulographum hederae CBS 113979]|uniref:N-acetyltransferase domain-containing protein n=1 Tax=Aulographum hederae CBS 113979 TaxID=1176131 RepID=A0A6G1GTD7_9PEZI|nr:hypothetical protein K402DRAFT_381385 [Aulographum hederae CBS 113979]
MSDQYTIRAAKSHEEARDTWWPLMQELGWNRSSDDALTHYTSTGPEGWLMLAPHDSEKPEGCIVPFVFDNNTGWVGFFALTAPYRGRGWGGALFQKCLDHLKENGATTVGLDAVAEQKKTYERRGFVETGMIRLEMRPSLKEMPLKEKLSSMRLKDGELLLEITKNTPKEVFARSDLAHTGMLRKKLWTDEALFSRKDTFGFYIASKPNDLMGLEIEGWIVVRRCEHGFRIGPLYATSFDHASILLRAAMQKTDGQEGSFIAETWMGNPNGPKVFEDLGFKWAEVDYHRMWIDAKAPKEQSKGGKAETDVYAMFDAGQG